jgi:hypothetical protein
MELSTGRLEASPPIAEGRLGQSAEERRQRTGRHLREGGSPTLTPTPAEDEALTAEEQEGHQLDDLA